MSTGVRYQKLADRAFVSYRVVTRLRGIVLGDVFRIRHGINRGWRYILPEGDGWSSLYRTRQEATEQLVVAARDAGKLETA